MGLVVLGIIVVAMWGWLQTREEAHRFTYSFLLRSLHLPPEISENICLVVLSRVSRLSPGESIGLEELVNISRPWGGAKKIADITYLTAILVKHGILRREVILFHSENGRGFSRYSTVSDCIQGSGVMPDVIRYVRLP